MPTEKFANNPASDLNGAINSSVTSFTVDDGSSFPTTGNFRVLIGSEIIIVGARTTNVCSSCTRGAENTTAASHADEDAVTVIVTAGSMAKNPRSMSATGDIEYLDSTGAPTSVAAPANGDYVVTFASGVPAWTAFSSVSGIPSGSIFPYGGVTAPSGYMLCDGSAISRATYATLFGTIGTAFGAGNGATTFNIPDLQQKFPLGKATSGTGSTLGSSGGNIDHTHSVPALTISASGVLDIGESGTSGSKIGRDTNNIAWIDGNGNWEQVTDHTVATPAQYYGAASHTHGAATGTGTSGTGNPPYQVVNYIIKT